MTIRVLVSAAGIVLLLANPGWAQSTTSSTVTPTTTTTGSFDKLSPGNQKIANALFSAQTTTGTKTPLSKNQIADLKATEGWGKVFRTMKADGLVSARNLGQVVSGHQHSRRTATTSTTRRSTTTTTTATTRSGRTTASGSTRSGSGVSSAGMTNGRDFASGSAAMGGGGFSHGRGGGFGSASGHGR
jgi:hypothetical protein